MTEPATMREVESGLLRLYQRTRDEWYSETASVMRERRMKIEGDAKWTERVSTTGWRAER